MDTGRLFRAYGDAIVAAGLACLYVLEAATSPFPVWPGPGIPALATAIGLLFLASLTWRRRWPLVVLALAFVPMAIAWVGPQGAPDAFVIGLLITTYSVGANTVGPSALIGAVGVAVVFAIAVLEESHGLQDVGDLAFLLLVIGGPWLAGVAIRLRRQRERGLERHAVQLELDRDEEVRAATRAERARIARDLHDVVAHSISIMVIQARGGRHALAENPAEAGAALDAIEAAGGQALTEMQRMLELLRDSDSEETALAPSPTLRHIGSLAEQVTRAGLPVEVSIEGAPVELSPGIDVSAYRIVQEALTNALKHAGPAIARVRIRYAGGSLELEVSDTGNGPAPVADTARVGHGLTGMRERARLYRGSVEAGPGPDGGFIVKASFPIEDGSQ